MIQIVLRYSNFEKTTVQQFQPHLSTKYFLLEKKYHSSKQVKNKLVLTEFWNDFSASNNSQDYDPELLLV